MTTPVKEIRRAAELMRHRAVKATPGRWEPKRDFAGSWVVNQIIDDGQFDDEYGEEILMESSADDAEHIASWHPGVALVVADWLDAAAEHDETPCPAVDSALTVARAYLGDQP